MSTTEMETQSARERRWIYITTCVILGIFVVTGLLAFSAGRQTVQAQEKADELIAAIEATGATAPTRERIVRVLGDDGGPTCEDPNSALRRSILLSRLSNGATGPGERPVIADSRAFQGQLLIMEVYCPDELEDFAAFVDELKTDDVAGG
jgi:Tfp pilus assembly protein FimT